AKDVVRRRLVRRDPARAVATDQHDLRLRAARQQACPGAARRATFGWARLLADPRAVHGLAQAREHRRDVGWKQAAGLVVARIASAARAAPRFDLVTTAAQEAPPPDRHFTRHV